MQSRGSTNTALAPTMLPVFGNRTIQAVILVVAGTALIAISANIKVPFYPVPMTLQTLAIMVIAASYGFRLGTLHQNQATRPLPQANPSGSVT